MMMKRCEYVTCVDCSQVFPGDQYQSHTKCISEAQKYMGSLYNTPGKKEGDKQNKWLDTINEILATYSGPLTQYVHKLKIYDNIPRKEKAFFSFVRNSMGIRDEQAIRGLWQLIDVKPKTWSGWEAEFRAILKAQGGRMHWKRLGEEGSKKYRQLNQAKISDRSLLNLAVASIPQPWLSEDSSSVSLDFFDLGFFRFRFFQIHKILGVAPGASKEAVRKAYLTLAKKFHPDLNKSPNAHVQFQKIQEAYSVLSQEAEFSGDGNSPGDRTPTREKREAPPTPKPGYRESAGFPGGAGAYWKFQTRARQQEFEREYARAADERLRAAAQNFDRGDFEINLLKKFLPIFFLPVFALVLAVNLARRFNEETPEKFRVFWDSDGRAFAEDAFGQLVRAEPLDIRPK